MADVIVSLTTIPSRLPYIKPTLDSLIKQTLKPAKIVLAIPYKSTRFNEPYIIPNWLTKENYPLVEILRCDDLGPATKILPVLKLDVDRVIFVDDDRVYSPDLVERLYNTSKERPNDAIAWTFSGYTSYFLGCCGVLVRKNMFTDDVYTIPENIRYVDDIWLSGHILKNGFKIWGIGCDDQERHDGNNIDALCNEKTRNELNMACVKYYLETHKILIHLTPTPVTRLKSNLLSRGSIFK